MSQPMPPMWLPYDPLRQGRIGNAGRIPKNDFKIVVGVFTGLAVLLAVVRCVFRLKLRHKIFFDDVLMIPLLNTTKWIDIYPAFIWTATFAIKFSFLAFFKGLIRDVSVKLTWYYWFVVVFTGMTWTFLVAEPFILCPYFGLGAVVSIPTIILRMTQLKRTQKAGIAGIGETRRSLYLYPSSLVSYKLY
ncbi:hypothetical protein P154DRAFT_540088 [Amniculicola lignicola CBS 123094]|uniref:Uncharacterized protein n=1 Tax=Amniculicola lignicola CBS 123094 TaxID=1392246 RepID=A0A6A5W837_9PLEO|nr:hypothetical protein P154DRAFT_540088 [Amniculicola lignicola CBS 123094]